METPAPLAPVVRLLGYAGLLPLIGCVAGLFVLPMHRALLLEIGFGYAALIYSFLGGLWWGEGIARVRAPGWLFVVAVLPSLIGWGLMLLQRIGLTVAVVLVPLGIAILVSPLVDLVLGRRAQGPTGWLMLRVQLSTGLGVMTLALALL